LSTNETKRSIGWEFLELCFSWRKFISIVTIVFTVLGIILAFVLPKEYEGKATVLPSANSSGLLGMLGMGSAVSSVAKQFTPLLGGAAQIGNGFNYLAILNSRDAMERVVRKFDLVKVYSISDSSMEKTIKELRSNTNFEIGEYEQVIVKVLDKDPLRAAAMANYYVDILNEINGSLSSEDARNLRMVIENRYLKNVSDLENAEDSLRFFQQKYGAFSLPEQAKASVTAGAELESQLILSQVKLSALEEQMSTTSPEVQMLNDQIQALKQKMKDLNTGGGLKSSGDFSVFVPFKDVPGKTMQYLDLYRDVEIQTKLMETIYPMYEQARLEEAKETPTVLVLDRAVPPEKKARPMRLLIILSSFFLGMILSVMFVALITNGAKKSLSSGELAQRSNEVSIKAVRKLNSGLASRNKLEI
jgi:capsule polysaccharide export protein KpsE/RkpR